MKNFLKIVTLSLGSFIFLTSANALVFAPIVERQEEGPQLSPYKKYIFMQKEDHTISFIRLVNSESHVNPDENPNAPLSEENFQNGKLWFGFTHMTSDIEMEFLNALKGSWNDPLLYDVQVQNQDKIPLSGENAMDFWRTHRGKVILDKASSEIRHSENGEHLGYFSYLKAPVKWFFSSRTPRILLTSKDTPEAQKEKWEKNGKLMYMCTRSIGYGIHEQNYPEAIASLEEAASLNWRHATLDPEEKHLWNYYLNLKMKFQTLRLLEILKTPLPSFQKDLNDHVGTLIHTLTEKRTYEFQSAEVTTDNSLALKLLLASHILKTDTSKTEEEKSVHTKEIKAILSSLNPATQEEVLPLLSPDPQRFHHMAGLFATIITPDIFQSHKVFTETAFSPEEAVKFAPLPRDVQNKLGTALKISSLFLKNFPR